MKNLFFLILVIFSCFSCASNDNNEPVKAPEITTVPKLLPSQEGKTDTLNTIKAEVYKNSKLTSKSTSEVLKEKNPVRAAEIICQNLLGNLWKEYGFTNYNSCPKVDVKKGMSIGGAAYYANSGFILLDMKTYEICKKLGEKQGEAALNFILAHELGHYFQYKREPSYFSEKPLKCILSHTKTLNSERFLEEEADYFAALSTGIAGHSLEGVLTQLMEFLYQEYNLIDSIPKGYPSLEVRKQAAQEVEERLPTLIELYKTAPKLTASGFYNEAKHIYDFLLSVFDGKEFRYNRAINKICQGLGLGDYNLDSCAYLIEWDFTTRLEKALPKKESMGPSDEKERIPHFKEAEKNIQEALAIDPNYRLAQLSLMTLRLIRNKDNDSIQLKQQYAFFEKEFQEGQLSKNNFDWAKLNYATFHTKINNKSIAEPILKELQSKTSHFISTIARINMNVLHGKKLKKTNIFSNSPNKLSKQLQTCKDTDTKNDLWIEEAPFEFGSSITDDFKTTVYKGKFRKIAMEEIALSPKILQIFQVLSKPNKDRKIISISINKQRHLGFILNESGEPTECFKICSETSKTQNNK